MPTPESAEAFAKLVAARERFAGITKQLTDANTHMHVSGDARRRYEALQKDWEEAYAEYNAATKLFATLVEHLPDSIGPKSG